MRWQEIISHLPKINFGLVWTWFYRYLTKFSSRPHEGVHNGYQAFLEQKARASEPTFIFALWLKNSIYQGIKHGQSRRQAEFKKRPEIQKVSKHVLSQPRRPSYGWALAVLWFNHLTAACQIHTRIRWSFYCSLSSQSNCSLVTTPVSSSMNDSASHLRSKTNSAFIGRFVDPPGSLVWQGNETTWPVAANGLTGIPFLISLLHVWVMQSSHTLNHSFEHKLEIRHSLFKSSSQTLINQAGHTVILSLLTL